MCELELAGRIHGVLFFRASVFSGTFVVYVLSWSVGLVVIFRGVGVIIADCGNFLDSERVETVFPDFDVLRDLCWLRQFLGLRACSLCPCIPVRMRADERSETIVLFLVLILLLRVPEVTFRDRKSRGFIVPARLTRGRSIGSLFMRRCWTLTEL